MGGQLCDGLHLLVDIKEIYSGLYCFLVYLLGFFCVVVLRTRCRPKKCDNLDIEHSQQRTDVTPVAVIVSDSDESFSFETDSMFSFCLYPLCT